MKLYLRNVLIICITVASLALTGCGSDEPTPEERIDSPSTLVKVTPKATQDKVYLQSLAQQVSAPLAQELKYDVQMQNITYTTSYQGSDIEVSARVYLPVTTSVVSTVVFNHGTIASNDEAPSLLNVFDFQNSLYGVLGSLGFVTVVPDYIGFGASSDRPHPYYIEDLSATTVVDAIYASRQAAERMDLDLGSELYLAGYSQGGYVTMATHKYIEEEGIDFFDLQASFPASGGYDIKAFQEYYFSLDTYQTPFFMAYLVNAYKEVLDLALPLSDLFQSPYDAEVPGFFNGSLTGEEINLNLTAKVSDLMTADILSGLDTDPKYGGFRQALIANSPIDFVPQVPIYMYHGDADVTVPYSNSESVRAGFLQQGASENVVTLSAIIGANHNTGLLPYLLQLVSELQELESQ